MLHLQKGELCCTKQSQKRMAEQGSADVYDRLEYPDFPVPVEEPEDDTDGQASGHVEVRR